MRSVKNYDVRNDVLKINKTPKPHLQNCKLPQTPMTTDEGRHLFEVVYPWGGGGGGCTPD